MPRYLNTNRDYGYSGPFEGESAAAIADEWRITFREWAEDKQLEGINRETDEIKLDMSSIEFDVELMIIEFTAGLEEIQGD